MCEGEREEHGGCLQYCERVCLFCLMSDGHLRAVRRFLIYEYISFTVFALRNLSALLWLFCKLLTDSGKVCLIDFGSSDWDSVWRACSYIYSMIIIACTMTTFWDASLFELIAVAISHTWDWGFYLGFHLRLYRLKERLGIFSIDYSKNLVD